MSEEELPCYFVDGRNIGMVLGGPAGVVDVDLDNPAAVATASVLLPNTLESGRRWSPRSHRWYLCYPLLAPKKYPLPKFMSERLILAPGEETLVEIRSTGQQTMIAPSIHPVDGDRCIWHSGEICKIDGVVLDDLVLDVAVAALLALNRPLGSREWFIVYAAGYLSPRVGLARAEKIVVAASSAFDDEEHDERMRAVRSSLRDPVDDDPAIDAALAAELKRLAPGVPDIISRWCERSGRDRGGVK